MEPPNQKNSLFAQMEAVNNEIRKAKNMSNASQTLCTDTSMTVAQTQSSFNQKLNRSTTQMPTYLVLMAALLLTARLIDMGMSLHKAAHDSGAPAVKWSSLSADVVRPPVATAAAPAPPQESPRTQEELKKLLAASKSSHKLLLLEFFANWSDPCKRMESSALSNSQVTSVIEDKFYPVRITDFQHESGNNTQVVNELFKKYRTFAFPTLVIVGEDGEPASILVGSCSSLTTYRFLTRAISQQKL